MGLDSDWEKLPEIVKKEEYPQFAFNKAIVDATHDLVCAYKPNSAFYEYLGSEGIRQLKLSCDYIREKYPEIPIIPGSKGSVQSSYPLAYIVMTEPRKTTAGIAEPTSALR